MKDKDFAKVYERNYKRSFLFAKSYVHDDLVAEDIAAESLFKYAHRLVALEDMAETAVRNLEIQVSALEACDPNELFSEEIQRIVQETLKTLPEKTQEIFFLSRYENKTLKEIATIVNLSPKTVEYHISQSLKALRIALKDYLPLWLIWFYWYQN